jgi:hypothetical protein
MQHEALELCSIGVMQQAALVSCNKQHWCHAACSIGVVQQASLVSCNIGVMQQAKIGVMQ